MVHGQTDETVRLCRMFFGTTPNNEKCPHARIWHYIGLQLQNFVFVKNVCSALPPRLKTFKAQPACPQSWFNAKICSHKHSKTCIQALYSSFLFLPASDLFLTAIANRHRCCKMMFSYTERATRTHTHTHRHAYSEPYLQEFPPSFSVWFMKKKKNIYIYIYIFDFM